MPLDVSNIAPAIVGGLAGWVASFVTNLLNRRLEMEKTAHSREDARLKALRDAAGEFAASASQVVHSMAWLTWRAERAPDRLGDEWFVRYDDELHKILPQLMAAVTKIAMLDGPAYEQATMVFNDIKAMDVKIGGIMIDMDHADAATQLGAIHHEIARYAARLPTALGSFNVDYRIY